jgi:hypothetical protein
VSTIEVAWPTAPLTEKQWRERVESLAEQAEAMIGRKDVGVQAQGRLAVEFTGLLWPALSAEVVAGSARASLLLGPPGVVLSSAPADQVQEIAERLDAIWAAAQTDPAAAVVEVPAVLLELPPPDEVRPRKPRRRGPKPEPAAPAPAADDPDELPAAWREPALPEPVVEPVAPPPSSWLTTEEVVELLAVSRSTISSWRQSGRFGAEGEGYMRHGKGYWHAPEVVEQLEQGNMPPELDQLLSEVQAA